MSTYIGGNSTSPLSHPEVYFVHYTSRVILYTPRPRLRPLPPRLPRIRQDSIFHSFPQMQRIGLYPIHQSVCKQEVRCMNFRQPAYKLQNRLHSFLQFSSLINSNSSGCVRNFVAIARVTSSVILLIMHCVIFNDIWSI